MTSFRIPEDVKADAKAIAYARSSPDNDVPLSDVYVAALKLYIEEHSDEVEEGWEQSSDLSGADRASS